MPVQQVEKVDHRRHRLGLSAFIAGKCVFTAAAEFSRFGLSQAQASANTGKILSYVLGVLLSNKGAECLKVRFGGEQIGAADEARATSRSARPPLSYSSLSTCGPTNSTRRSAAEPSWVFRLENTLSLNRAQPAKAWCRRRSDPTGQPKFRFEPLAPV